MSAIVSRTSSKAAFAIFVFSLSTIFFPMRGYSQTAEAPSPEDMMKLQELIAARMEQQMGGSEADMPQSCTGCHEQKAQQKAQCKNCPACLLGD